MRLLQKLQLFFQPNKPETDRFSELKEVGRILRSLPEYREICARVIKEATHGKGGKGGAEGASAEQIVGLGFLRARYEMTFRDLEHATQDSLSVREFLNLGPSQWFKKSSINANLKSLSEGTFVYINECLKKYAKKEGIEDGTIVRADTTATETNIHYPTDASLLCDSVRALTRILERAKAWTSIKIESSNHHHRVRHLLYVINNTTKAREKHENYLDMIRVTRKVVQYAQEALPLFEKYAPNSLEELAFVNGATADLKRYIPLVNQVIDQSYRRIVNSEDVPASEKIVSLFEPETDILAKGKRDVVFGHKVLMSTGTSSLILHLSILAGNPADSTLVIPLIDSHIASYGQAPEKLAFDGGFASRRNRDVAKNEKGVKEILFSKNIGMKPESLVSSKAIDKFLRCFRAGAEGCISFLKRCFGFRRVLSKTKETFKAVLQCAAVAYNLTLLARTNLGRATA